MDAALPLLDEDEEQEDEASHCSLLFIRSRRFFRSSRSPAGEAERVFARVGESALRSCWYCSRDSFSCDSLLCSMSVDETTAGLDINEMVGCCWDSPSPLLRPACWKGGGGGGNQLQFKQFHPHLHSTMKSFFTFEVEDKNPLEETDIST